MSLKRGIEIDHRRQGIDMNEAKLTTLEQIKAFLKGTEAVDFSVCGEGGDATALSARCCDDSAMGNWDGRLPASVIQALLDGFPGFLGFHADNGSEYTIGAVVCYIVVLGKGGCLSSDPPPSTGSTYLPCCQE